MNGQCDIAVIGLEVMGRNLALNIESRGYRVAVYNRTVEKMEKF
ncbi:MAG TPA: NAD(P)-binding domain-containing protein, partial [Thermogutta sp.]|nr:NAD(P)-binding domain-containing protein [Thermogutta sp.]